MTLHAMGKILLVLGIVLAGAGLVLIFSDRLPFLGKLPGDIHIEKPGFQLHIPIATSILLSVLLSLILWLIGYWRGK